MGRDVDRGTQGSGTKNDWTDITADVMHWFAIGTWTVAGTVLVVSPFAGPGMPVVATVGLYIGGAGAIAYQVGDAIEWLGDKL